MDWKTTFSMLDKESARAAWFSAFDQWQAGFNRLLAAVAAGKNHVMEGKKFLNDVMVPWMDEAKDRLLRAFAGDVLAAAEKAARLDALVNKENA